MNFNLSRPTLSGFTDFLKRNRIDIVIVIFLFIFSFGVRILPRQNLNEADQEVPELETGGLMGFDSFHDARWSKHVAQGNWFPHDDVTTLYPFGRDRGPSDLGFWLPNAAIYRAVGGPVEPFDYHLMGRIMSWMNAIYGALAIVFIYLLGKHLYNRTTGLASGLFLGAMSANLFYSIFGHAENDAMGLMLFFLSILLFVLTVKKRSWKYGIATTLSLGWLPLVWQSYNVVVLLIGGTVGLYFLLYAGLKPFEYYKESEERKELRKWMLYGCIFVLLSILVEPIVVGYFNISYGVNAILPVGLALLIGSVIELIYSGRYKSLFSTFKKPKSLLKGHAAEKGLIFSLIFLLGGGLILGPTIINSPAGFVGLDIEIGETETDRRWEYRDAEEESELYDRVQTTISEQREYEGGLLERIDHLSDQFGLAIWLAFIAAIILFGKLFMMPFVRNDFNYHWDILALGFILGSLVLLTTRAIETFFLTAGVAMGAGYFFGLLERIVKYGLKGKTEIYKYLCLVIIVIIGLFFFANAFIATERSKEFDSGFHPEWQETLHWIRENETVEEGSVFTFWWDYGHWTNYYAGDKVFSSLDNIHTPASPIYSVASSFTHSPECELEIEEAMQDPQQQQIPEIHYECDTSQEALDRAEKESLSLLKPLHTDYIVIDKEIVGGRTGGKWNALLTIAQPDYTREGLMPCMQTLPCEEVEDEMGLGEEMTTVIDCGGVRLPEHEWERIKEADYPGYYHEQLAEEGLDTNLFAREDSQGKTLYMPGIACGEAFFQGGATRRTPTMHTFAHRMFFGDDSLNHVEKVYENEWLVVYEVKDMDEIPHPSEFTDFTQRRHVTPEQPEELPKEPVG